MCPVGSASGANPVGRSACGSPDTREFIEVLAAAVTAFDRNETYTCASRLKRLAVVKDHLHLPHSLRVLLLRQRLDLDVAERNRLVVPGEAEVAVLAHTAGMRLLAHEFGHGADIAVND